MNKEKLLGAKEYFFELYPKGFDDEELIKIKKRHKTEKLGGEVEELFKEDNFAQPERICENFSKIVSKSSLVSLFEKPKVRDMVKGFSSEQRDIFSIGLKELLYGSKKNGFEILVEILAPEKLAKWSIISLIPYYLKRDKEYFIKPTTTKNIIKTFELEGVVYKPTPSYQFYKAYTKQLSEMKKFLKIDTKKDNAAFTGFLMIAMREE